MEWTKKQDPTVYCVEDIHLKYRDTHRLKVNEWRKIKQAETPGKKAGVAVLIPHYADLRARKVIEIKRDIYHDKGSVLQDDVTVLSVSTHSTKVCEAQTDRTTGERDGPTIVCEMSTPPTRNGQIQQAEKSVKI